MAKKLNIFAWLITLLVTVGAINWGILGVSSLIGSPFNLVNTITFGVETLENIIYILVGIAGLALVPTVLAMIFGKR